MSKFATRLLILAMCAVSLALVPIVTPAKAEASHSKHIKKHKKIRRGPAISDPWSAGYAWPNNQAWPGNRPSSQPSHTCFRAFECAKWPPPFDEDPDRKASGTDQ
jgi:hypothetical protein